MTFFKPHEDPQQDCYIITIFVVAVEGRVPRTTVRGTRSSVHDPIASAPSSPVPVTRAGNVSPGVTVLGPRSPHLGPRSSGLVAMRCNDTRGGPEQTETTCTPTTNPNEKAADRIWRPNKYRCLPKARPQKKGGVGVHLAAFSSGWKGSSYPRCVRGVAANLGFVRGWRA